MPEADKNSVPVSGEESELSEEELANVTGGTTFNTNTLPSTSVGADKSIGVQSATTRQTIDQSLASNLKRGLGQI